MKMRFSEASVNLSFFSGLHLLLDLAPKMGKKTSVFAVLSAENLILAKTINCYLDYEKDS